ncbi:hypothetical protein LOC71_04245 [Rhodopirellula sp. JC740]|uniref:Glycoamylase-like domain-containing protein n=1 Tax=Rhodopirellula halodulae TaxID=2894198 RepID=A0ABS8ND51_9BACT|nr:glucoamylase family protein [Rhodopirellula sp. JC740]MCC9641472.1 hypothetical protein [Rhodopirellula sp. JC740]
MKRRALLSAIAATPLLAAHRLRGDGEFPSITSATPDHMDALMQDDTAYPFLDDLRRRCYTYFEDSADPETGLIADRGHADGSSFSDYASSAACGFGLAAHGIAAENGWISREQGAERARTMLEFLVHRAAHERGLIYHFVDRLTGERALDCEASTIDTALLIAGAMHASQTFHDDRAIVELAEELYGRVDWRWMLGENGCLHMGWQPETGRLPHQWDRFSELTILVLLAIGAPQNPIPADCWNAWRRETELHHNGESFVSYPPLFVHQYPHAFFDFRGQVSSDGRNYWRNSQLAHAAQVQFQADLAEKYPRRFGHYGDQLWGLTSSDSETGYRDWGGPYQDGVVEPDRGIDGTVVPSAAGGGLAVAPEATMRTLQHQKRTFGDAVYGRYGFVNAFNPRNGWIGTDVIGIDTGITLLSASNLLEEGVWKPFMSHPAAQRALRLAGFRPLPA